MTVELARLIEMVASRIIAATEELTTLDSAIGDADHGLNMKRGFEAVLVDEPKIVAMALPDALKAIGMVLVMKVGGASGPLYGTLLMTLGKELPAEPGPEDISRAVDAAVKAVMARGKSDLGAKTMLDVLGPVSDVLRASDSSLGAIRRTATASAAATVPMKATRGRASFLGDRSIGHMDPGARSSEIMIHAVCDVLEGGA